MSTLHRDKPLKGLRTLPWPHPRGPWPRGQSTPHLCVPLGQGEQAREQWMAKSHSTGNGSTCPIRLKGGPWMSPTLNSGFHLLWAD